MINNLTKLLSNSKTSLINDQSTVYFFNKQNNVNFGPGWKNMVTSVLNAYFKKIGYLISKPVFVITPGKVKIHLFYYRSGNGLGLDNRSKFGFRSGAQKAEVQNKNPKRLSLEYLTSMLGTTKAQFKDWLMINFTLKQLESIKKTIKIIEESPILFLKGFKKSIKPGTGARSRSRTGTRTGARIRNLTLSSNRYTSAAKLTSALTNLHFLYLHTNRMRDITIFLSKVLEIDVELEVVRLKHPYHDSNILAQLIGINGRTSTFRRLKTIVLSTASISTLGKGIPQHSIVKGPNTGPGIKINGAELQVNSSNLPANLKAVPALTTTAAINSIKINKTETNLINSVSNEAAENLVTPGSRVVTEKNEIVSRLTGIKLRISGRLPRQRVVPKRTVKSAYKGSVSKAKFNLVDSSTFTSKSKKGAFSVRVWLSHGINKID